MWDSYPLGSKNIWILEYYKKLGIELIVEDPIEFTMDVIKKTGENTNSMLSDIRNKRKTEIDFITGKIISLAEQLDIEVPHNKEVYDKIIALERAYLKS